MSELNLFKSMTKAIKAEGMEEAEEMLMIKRANGHGVTVCIPLSMLFVFTEDGEMAVERMKNYCDMMFGKAGWSKGEFMHLSRFIESRLEALNNTAPERMQTKNEFENALDRMQVKIEHGGETLIDTMEGKHKQVFLGSAG